MITACLDLEGDLIPEVWQNVSRLTGVPELMLTTRDVPDYDELMNKRLKILRENSLTIRHIQEAIATMEPLPGAIEFLAELRSSVRVIILSDTFVEFMPSFMKQLDYPTLFCNSLEIGPDGAVTDYHLRQKRGKLEAVRALKGLNFEVRAAGDSYNDLEMILEADRGALFRSTKSIQRDYPSLPAFTEFADLLPFLTAPESVTTPVE